MRAVVDTHVFVSSFFGGPPREIIDCWKRGELTLCLSREILDEYVEVLNRLGLEAQLVQELLELFASGFNVVFTAQTAPLQVLKRDPDDNMLFECAVELDAKVIITGDKAVRAVGRYMDIDAMAPAEFLRATGSEVHAC
jgi:uncharacterized protein